MMNQVKRRKELRGAAWLWALGWGLGRSVAEQRFPPPDFESGYQLPLTQTPAPRSLLLQYVDVGILAVALALACYLVYRRRSRTGVLALSLFSLVYFGFYREGCICAIGAPQNVALALFDSTYALPLTAAAFFLLPLAVALFAGRTFCAAVCPQGALQDLVLLRPVKVPAWLEQGLSVIPFIFLGAGLALAATGSAFVICRYDPFVPLFRLSGSFMLLLAGGLFLLLGMFVGRPYCRFLCPYGALLRLASIVSKWRVRITPDYCTRCQLCETSCPFGAIRTPVALPANPLALAPERKRLGWLVLLLPALVAAGALLGSRLTPVAAKLHPTVALAESYLDPHRAPTPPGVQTPESLALGRAEQNPTELIASALDVRRRLGTAMVWFGGWVGLVIGVKLIRLSIRSGRTDFEPDRAACFACARCYLHCPNERVRLGLMPASELPAIQPLPAPTLPQTGSHTT
ncbi:MAG: 4Fe-4S binding protein [Verrucomicrobia bacterium]|nr:4Fe-4S binding protein [Verrucomicrobiota bacterium]